MPAVKAMSVSLGNSENSLEDFLSEFVTTIVTEARGLIVENADSVDTLLSQWEIERPRLLAYRILESFGGCNGAQNT